jgi:hypothetical protein
MLRSMIVASMRQRDSHLSSGIADCYLNLDMQGIGVLDFDDPATIAQRGYEAAMPIQEAWLELRAESQANDETAPRPFSRIKWRGFRAI